MTIGPMRDQEGRWITEVHPKLRAFHASALPDGDLTGYDYTRWDYREKEFNPWVSFAEGDNFKLARWFMQHRVSDTAIQEYFNTGLSNNKTSFRSAHTMYQQVDAIHPALSSDKWKEGTATFGADVKNAKQKYYFRKVKEAVTFLLQQPTFRDHLVYRPVKEYAVNDEGEKVRVYSEVNTGDWWWREQVSVFCYIGLMLTRKSQNLVKASSLSLLF